MIPQIGLYCGSFVAKTSARNARDASTASVSSRQTGYLDACACGSFRIIPSFRRSGSGPIASRFSA